MRWGSLLVEDSIDQQGIFKLALESAGYAVHTAYMGQQALDQARQTAFDLVILDVNLAGSLDGIEVLSQLKGDTTTAAAPVLVMSAHAHQDENMEQRAKAAGAEQFLAKPLLISQLLGHVERILQSRPKV